jgi:triacylglycerol lipase/cholesterol oxidase
MDRTFVEFTERMAGYFVPHKMTLSALDTLSRDKFTSQENIGLRKDFEFTATIHIPDLNKFIDDHSSPSEIQGSISDLRFGGMANIEKGYFQLFTKPSASPDFDTSKEMHYTMFLRDQDGQKWTFFGFKEILKENPTTLWQQTTTLYCYLWEGHSTFETYSEKNVHAIGCLKISMSDFAQQMKSFKTNQTSFVGHHTSLLKFFKAFSENLWQAYIPRISESARWNEYEYPLHTTQGVKEGEVTSHHLNTRDGLALSLQRFKKSESKDIVLLLHGLTTSTDMYIMPEHYNLVNYLHDNSYPDVWSFDWRGSGRFTYNIDPHKFSFDDAAKYDMPAALEFIRAKCGADVRIHVIAHCVGSLAFMASYAAGYVSGVTSIISNSVSLTPRVPWQARMKMMVAPEALEYVLGYSYLTPKIPYLPGKGFGKALYLMEKTLRHECKEPACHMVSFMWGWGFPGAFNHRNIHPVTHRRLKDLFGGVSFYYYRHIRKMILAGAMVSYSEKKQINYLEEMKNRELPPTLLVSGTDNQIFPGSNKKTFEILKTTMNASRVQYKEFSGYGHQDIFIGQYCATEVFPQFVEFLNKHRLQEIENTSENNSENKDIGNLRIA